MDSAIMRVPHRLPIFAHCAKLILHADVNATICICPDKITLPPPPREVEVETVLVHHTSSLLTSPPPPSTVNNEATWHATSLQQCNCQWEFCCWNLMHLPVISGGCVVPAVQLSLRGVRSETRQLTIYTVLLTPP